MTIFKKEPIENYTIMSNYHLQDNNLSLKAKGLLSVMLSLPDEWDYSSRGLSTICKETKDTINKTLKELEENGYLERKAVYLNGKISDWEYIIHSNNLCIKKQDIEKQDIEKQDIVVQDIEKQDIESYDGNKILNNKILTNKLLNNKILNNKKKNNKKEKDNFNQSLFEMFWEAYPKKVSKGNAEKWFAKNQPNEELVNLMISKIEILKKTKQWLSNDGQYIPYPTSWLNAKGWEDEIGKVVEKEPEWFGKKVEIQNSTSDEKKEIEDLLNDYK